MGMRPPIIQNSSRMVHKVSWVPQCKVLMLALAIISVVSDDCFGKIAGCLLPMLSYDA